MLITDIVFTGFISIIFAIIVFGDLFTKIEELKKRINKLTKINSKTPDKK